MTEYCIKRFLLFVFLFILSFPAVSVGEEDFDQLKEYKSFYHELTAFRNGNYGRYDRFFRDVRKKRGKYRRKELKLFAEFGLGFLAFDHDKKFDYAKKQFQIVIDKMVALSPEQKKIFWKVLDSVNLHLDMEDLDKLAIRAPEETKPNIEMFEYIAQIYESVDTVYSLQNSQNIRTVLLDKLEMSDITRNVSGHEELYDVILKRMTEASKRLQEVTPLIIDQGKAQQ